MIKCFEKKVLLLVLFVSLHLLLFQKIINAQEAINNNESESSAILFELDTIVVTANKTDESIQDIPKHVTVITQDDIKASSGNNIIDLLAKESGIVIRSTSGNDKQAVVDIRGMGDAAASNVIVMVDDLLLNAPDQSGPAISSIPVEQIERIEIVRGAGSVIYGNGAVGGVINIITKKQGKEATSNIYSSYGSFNSIDTRASFGGSVNDFFINMDTGFFDSDGYRDNESFTKKDFSTTANYTLNNHFSFKLSGTYYEDEYGLPGPVSESDVHSSSRRKMSKRPDDSGESSEIRGRAAVDVDLEQWGILTLKRGYRFRDNDYIIGYTPKLSRSEQKDEIEEDTRQFDLNYLKKYHLYSNPQVFQFGIDHFATEYIRTENPDGPRKNIATESFGIFINNRWALSEHLMINAGTRYNTFKRRFRTDTKKTFNVMKSWVNGTATKSDWDNNAVTFGVTYLLTEKTTVFGSYSTSFRVPNVDEFSESEKGLRPQEGVHCEIGGRQQFGEIMILTVSCFDIRIRDEIYYSDINRNYDDKTIRQGVEIDYTLYPTDSVRLWGNYSFTKAEFDQTGNTIPLVPSHRASSGINWEIVPKLQISFSGTYSGSRYDGNDLENSRYKKLSSYTVFDSKITYEYKNVTFFAGINNIFNELYSTSAYSEQYYPMPDRNIFGGIRWKLF